MRIKKGDTVQVLSGNDKGKTGEVMEVIPKTEKIIVKGVNIRKKSVKPRRQGEQGGIIPPSSPCFLGLICFFLILIPLTIIFCVLGITSNTSPVFPLSFPDKTWTVSPFFIFIAGFSSFYYKTSGANDNIFM